MEMDVGSLDVGNWPAENMETYADAVILARPDPLWRKCDSFESILYDLMSSEHQVNAQNGDLLKTNQYFWHYVEDVDTDGNIRHFAVNNPEPVIKEEDGVLTPELPADDAGKLITEGKPPDESGSTSKGSHLAGPMQQSAEHVAESEANDSGLFEDSAELADYSLFGEPVEPIVEVKPSASGPPEELPARQKKRSQGEKSRIKGGSDPAAVQEPKRRSRRLEEKQVGPFCRSIGIQHQEVQRPGFSDGFKLPAGLMTMGVVFEIAEHMKRLGQPRNRLIRCLEHLFRLEHYNWQSPRFVSRFYRFLKEFAAERIRIKRNRMGSDAFNAMPFHIPLDGSKRLQQLERHCRVLKRRVVQLRRANRLLSKRLRLQSLQKRFRSRWNAF